MLKPLLFSKPLRAFATFAVGNIGYLFYHLPNKTFIDDVLSITESYKDTNPVPVSETIRLLFNEVMDDMKISEEDKPKIHLYTFCNLDFFYAGSIWKSDIINGFNKAIIGIPPYFNWDKLLEEIKLKMIFRGEKLDWSSEQEKNLEHSMLISDKAKKFGLAQNLFYASSFEPLYNGAITATVAMIALQFVVIILGSETFKHKRFKSLRYFAAFVSVLFNYVVWLLFKDAYRCHLESKADEAVAQLGEKYIEGGVEYYDSILQKNVALRDMTFDKGFWSPFSLFGNEQMTFRQKHLPLSGRRDYFMKLLNEEKDK